MSTVNVIDFKLKELKQLASDTNSCVVEKTVAQNLALQPWCLGNIEESIKTLLDYKIWKYSKEFDGILLSYKNLRIRNVGMISNDNAVYFPVQADYFIFKPYVGATLKGIVNKKSDTHLGVLVHRVFNVVIPRPTDELGNTWVGTSIQENQEVVFKVVVLDLYGALPYIRGELDERWLEQANEDEETFELTHNKSVDVSYVDFDKIKPSPKQLPENTQKSEKNSPSTKKHSKVKTIVDNDTANVVMFKGSDESEINAQNKTKTKRHKLANSDIKDVETNAKTSEKKSPSTKKHSKVKTTVDDDTTNGECSDESDVIVQKSKTKRQKLSDSDIKDVETNVKTHKKRKKESGQ